MRVFPMRGQFDLTWIAAVVLVGSVVWFAIGPTRQYAVGHLTTDNPAAIVVLTTSATITDGNYDTLQSPQGTAYEVPAAQILTLGTVTGEPLGAAGTPALLELGCGSTAVQDSATPPADPVVLYSVTWETNMQPPVDRPVFAACPSGTYPWVHMAGGAYAVTAMGVLR